MGSWRDREIKVHTVDQVAKHLLDFAVEGMSEIQLARRIAKRMPILARSGKSGIYRYRVNVQGGRKAKQAYVESVVLRVKNHRKLSC